MRARCALTAPAASIALAEPKKGVKEGRVRVYTDLDEWTAMYCFVEVHPPHFGLGLSKDAVTTRVMLDDATAFVSADADFGGAEGRTGGFKVGAQVRMPRVPAKI